LNSKDHSASAAGLDPSNLPQHVAIIMDGNGRWAKKRLLNRINGHEKGAETVRTIVRTSREIGISVLTLYAFSTENWQRPKSEVAALMILLRKFLESELSELIENNIQLQAIGQIERLPQDVLQVLRHTMDRTQDKDGMILNLALSYGARSEIIDMVKVIGAKLQTGQLGPDDVTAELVDQHLYTRDLPDPDLLIRTSGEMRVSNFLLWQIAYAELFITKTLWPDFNRDEYLRILKDYQTRDRRYGKVGA
jgi:undecaprenyl diphosphate synthase